jgi:Tol biopolymer transport system component
MKRPCRAVLLEALSTAALTGFSRRHIFKNGIHFGLFLIAWFLAISAQGAQIVSTIDNPDLRSASGNGDSLLPVMSSDGRFAAFTSTANNLCTLQGMNQIPLLIPPRMNVYLRDRQSGKTTLVSVDQTGMGGGNGNSWPVAVSTNGQYVLFESAASDLVALDTNNADDIFLRDLTAGETKLISISTNGTSGNLGSRSAVMTPDAHWIAFASEANNLVSGDTNAIADIFVRDVQSGTTVLASPGARSTGSATSLFGASEAPEISADGRYVAFYSTATNLVTGVRSTSEVYVRDLVGQKTLFASAGSRSAAFSAFGTSNNIASFNHTISADGHYVAYEAATNRGLVLRFDLATEITEIVATNASVSTASLEDIHNLAISPEGRFVAFVATSNNLSVVNTSVELWDAQNATTTAVSVDTNNLVPSGLLCDSPAVDESGRYVSFVSSGDLTGTSVPGVHVFLRDMQLGATTLVDTGPGGIPSRGVSFATSPGLSGDGRMVLFESLSSDLSEGDRNRAFDVFLRDTANPGAELVSSVAPALESLTPNGMSTLTPFSLSASGQYVAFSTEADNLFANDTNGCRDVFIRDVLVGSNVLVSVNTNGILTGNGVSTSPSITSDGRFVTFASFANDLVAGDTNHYMDVFLRDVQVGSTETISISYDGTQLGNADSHSPVISSDGRYVLFRSKAKNLVSGVIFSGYENLFVRDLQNKTNYALTTTGVLSAGSTPDGRFVVFTTGAAGATGGPLYVWSAQAAARVYTNNSSIVAATISPDGKKVAFWIGTATRTLYVGDVAGGAPVTIGTSTLAPPAHSIRFSGDGRFLACLVAVDGSNQVHIYDTQTSSLVLVTRSFDGSGAGNAGSDSVDFSADGRFIAYRSSASNLVPVDTNAVPDVFLYDTTTGSTILLSLSQAGPVTAANRSLLPVFSADSRTVFFQSWAPDLAAGDGNQSSDVMGYTLYSSGIIPLFSARMVGGTAGGGNVITWPVVPGKSYMVQYKDNLTDPDWENAGQGVLVGNQGWFQDSAAPSQRFYRILAF